MADDFKIDRGTVNPQKYIYRKESDISKTLIDWSSITKDLTEVLTDIRDDRQTKKDEDAKLSQDVTETLTELTVDTEYEPLEVAVRQVTEEYKDFNMMNYNLLKTGQLTRREFASRMAAAQLNMSTFKDLADNFAEKYKIYGDRLVDQSSNIFEHALGESMASFKNLAGQDMYVNPVTGNVQIVKKQYKTDKDGNTILDDDGQRILIPINERDRSNFKSLKTFGPRLNQKSNFVDVQGEITKNAKSIARDIDSSFGQRQSIEKIKEALLLKEDDQKSRIIDGYVNSALATEAKKVSALQQILGYSKNVFTENPKEVEEWKKQYEVLKKAADMGEDGAQEKLEQWLSGENVKILMKPRGDESGEMGVEFDGAVMDHLKDAVADQYAGRLAKEITLKAGYQPPTSRSSGRGSGLNQTQTDVYGLYRAFVNSVEANTIQSADAAETELSNLLTALSKKPIDVEKDKKGVYLITSPGMNDITISSRRADGTLKTENEILKELWGTTATIGASTYNHDAARQLYVQQRGTFKVPDYTTPGKARTQKKVTMPPDPTGSITQDGKTINIDDLRPSIKTLSEYPMISEYYDRSTGQLDPTIFTELENFLTTAGTLTDVSGNMVVPDVEVTYTLPSKMIGDLKGADDDELVIRYGNTIVRRKNVFNSGRGPGVATVSSDEDFGLDAGTINARLENYYKDNNLDIPSLNFEDEVNKFVNNEFIKLQKTKNLDPTMINNDLGDFGNMNPQDKLRIIVNWMESGSKSEQKKKRDAFFSSVKGVPSKKIDPIMKDFQRIFGFRSNFF